MVTAGDLKDSDLEIVKNIIDSAKEDINNAKTKTEVADAQKRFTDLLNSNTDYKKLVDNVKNETETITKKQEANNELDLYKETISEMSDNELNEYDRNIIESEIQVAKDAIEDATTPEDVEKAISTFKAVMETYPEVTEVATEKLVTDAMNKAISELEKYITEKYSTYIVKQATEITEAETVKSLAESYIDDIKDIAEDETKEDRVTEINNTLTTDKNYLDDQIEVIEEQIKADYDKYLKEYNKAIKELDEYAANASTDTTLSASQLSAINELIGSTKKKIANDVETDVAVRNAMGLFRNAVVTYAPEFAENQIELARESALETLEEYKDSKVDEVAEIANTAIRNIKNNTTMTANEITEALNKAMDEINEKINAQEVSSAKTEATDNFISYLDDEYSDAVNKIAQEAIDTIDKLETKREIEITVKEYMEKIDAQLIEEGKSLQQLIEDDRANALDKIAEYKDLAKKANEMDLLSEIIPYENKVKASTATRESIAEALQTLQDKIETEYPEVSDKLDAIKEIEAGEYLQERGYINDQAKSTETAEIKDAINSAIERIKKAKTTEDVNTIKTEEIANIETVAKNIDKMETARTTAKASINELNNNAKNIKDSYIRKVEAVTLNEYVKSVDNDKDGIIEEGENGNGQSAFDKLVAQATADVNTYIENGIKNNKNTSTSTNASALDEVLKEELFDESKDKDLTIDNLQQSIKTEVDEEGNGKISGTLKHAVFNGFSNNENEQNGYYLCLKIENKYADKITVQKEVVSTREASTEKELDKDGVIVILIPEACIDKENNKIKENSLKITVKFYVSGIDDAIDEIVYNDFTGITLDTKSNIEEANQNALNSELTSETEVGLGSHTVSEFNEGKVETTVDENGKGYVSGTLKYVENFTEFNNSNDTEQKGHYLVLKIENKFAKCYSITKTVSGEIKTSKVINLSDDTLILHIPDECIENGKIKENQLKLEFKFYDESISSEVGKTPISIITFEDFSNLTLLEKSGE